MSHNPTAIDEDTPPDFVNEQRVRWWQLDMGDKQDGVPFLVDNKGERNYVIVKGSQIIYDTKSLEALAFKFDELRLRRTLP